MLIVKNFKDKRLLHLSEAETAWGHGHWWAWDGKLQHEQELWGSYQQILACRPSKDSDKSVISIGST